jgi:hypothetical protein
MWGDPTAKPDHRVLGVWLLSAALIAGGPALGQVSFTDINPNQSTLHPSDPDGASGGRVNGLASVERDPNTYYAATEWGGIYKSTDRGRTWARLDAHLPVATWDVAVLPQRPQTVIATSFYDGRVASQAGINVSNDGGATWAKPATSTPPAGFCEPARRNEPAGFGISIDRRNPDRVYVGTNCGLAISNDGGASWSFVDPTPNDPATNIWDVVAHGGQIVDICGDDGHFRSVNAGATWTPGSGLPSGICSIAASPHEREVVFAAVGADAWETDNGGGSWTRLGTPDSRRQGRIPFVETNPRTVPEPQIQAFDLWYGDVRLYRAGCRSNPPGGGLRCPMATTGAMLPPTPPAGWDGPFTRSAGGHDDVGAIVFAPGAGENACPVLFSSDGGVYFNTRETSPDCHRPLWQQPNVTPHALWLWALTGSTQPGVLAEDLYFGNQDNGSFGTTNAGAPSPTWVNRDCCDGFDDSSNPSRVLYTICCFSPPPGNRLFLRNPGLVGGAEINTYPPGSFPGFRPIDVIGNFGPTDFVVVTTQGVFITNNVTAMPIVWTQLGAATSPAGACGIKLGVAGGQPTFFVQAGVCDGRTADQLWKFVGTNPAGAWVRIDSNLPAGGVGVFAIDPGNPNRLYASNIASTGPRMMLSTDGGTTWSNDAGLDSAMTGGGAFVYRNQRGPTAFTGFGGYPQPTLVAFDPQDPNILVAGGADSGVFVSTDGGGSWSVITDPITSGTSGKPHLPRPWFVHFDHEPPNRVKLLIGTQGRGVWRAEFEVPEPRFEYAAKLVCGIQDDPANLRLARGLYATTINVHNPNQQTAVFKKKLALTFPPAEQRPGKILPISQDTLRDDEALAVDCIDIQKRLFPTGFPTPYIEGFIVIRSLVSLDVTAVYSTGVAGKDGCCRASKTNPAIDVVQIRERIIAQAPRPPDLLPVNPQPSAGRLGFCRRDPTSGRLVVTVGNQGAGPAGPSRTTVNFTTGNTVTSVTMNTPVIPAGSTLDVMAAIPAGCFRPDCAFQIVADSSAEVGESNEANNVADGLCRG